MKSMIPIRERLTERAKLLAAAALLVLLAGSRGYAQQTTPTVLAAPSISYASGGKFFSPTPMQIIGYDSSTGFPCIIGYDATCNLPISGGGGGVVTTSPNGGATGILAVGGAAGSAPVPVSGTFWQTTQPVSLATLPPLVAGSAIIGKAGIDQTTPGTTNGVVVNSSVLPTGAALDASLQSILTKLNASIAVTGTFWQTTQPVSLASLPAPYNTTDLGPCQITVAGSAIGLTGGTGICSASIPSGATTAVFTVETQPIRWAGTGTTNPPTNSFGNLQSAGTSFQYGPDANALANFRMIDTAAGSATVDVEFFK